MNNKNISLGLIGIGYWGKNLARNLNDLGVLKSICDLNLENINFSKKKYSHIEHYNEIDQLLDSNIDGVVIATPAVTHGSLVTKALNKGKHVFVEKPLCLDVKEGQTLIRLAKKNNLKLMVGHLLLYHPAFIALKAVVSRGSIGKIRYLYSNRLSLGKLRKEENALWSFAPHDISMILSILNMDPITVEASGGSFMNRGIVDTSMTFMHFPDGIKAHVFVSWLHPYKDQRLIVVGDKGMITFNDVEKNENKLILYQHDVEWKGDIPVIEKAEGKSIKFDVNIEPLRFECESFLNWIKLDIKPPSDGEEGLRVLKVLDRAESELKRKL